MIGFKKLRRRRFRIAADQLNYILARSQEVCEKKLKKVIIT